LGRLFEEKNMMKPNKFYLFLNVLMILLTITACGRLGKTPPAGPTIDSRARATSLAGTALAAAASMPSPTETLVPTPRISIYGTSLVIREDGSALFVDHKAGIQLTIPAGWLPVRVNEDEYYKAYTLDVVLQNPVIFDRLTSTQSVNLDFHRLDAIDIREGHIPNEIISVINVVFQENDVRSLEKWAQAERSRKLPFSGYKFISSEYPRTADGTRVLMIEKKWDAEQKRGTIYYRGMFFSLATGTIVLDLYTNNDFKDTVLPDFEQVVNSLTLLNP
jgi:hypothetical protein